jgi:hypothetical protein
VWQWCEDWVNQNQKARVLRGAAFVTGDGGGMLSTHRYSASAMVRESFYGFRPVLEPAPSIP